MKKTIYWASTVLLALLLIFSTGMYVFNHEMVIAAYQSLEYPTYLIYPNATLKVLAALAILTRKVPKLTEWAYAGLFYLLVLGLTAHLAIGDGQFWAAAVSLVFWFASYFTQSVRAKA